MLNQYFKYATVLCALGGFQGLSVQAVQSEASAYPCIQEYKCQAAEDVDNAIQSVSVDYYDDLGSKFHWTHQIHKMEGVNECSAAVEQFFPYTFFKKCEADTNS